MTEYKTLTELQSMSAPFVPPMSKKDKLLRWAALIKKAPQVRMDYEIEYMSISQLKMAGGDGTIFAIAASDPIFQDAGLAGPSAYDGKKFFELSQEEMHVFTCGCHGMLSNESIARRIEHLASFR